MTIDTLTNILFVVLEYERWLWFGQFRALNHVLLSPKSTAGNLIRTRETRSWTTLLEGSSWPRVELEVKGSKGWSWVAKSDLKARTWRRCAGDLGSSFPCYKLCYFLVFLQFRNFFWHFLIQWILVLKFLCFCN